MNGIYVIEFLISNIPQFEEPSQEWMLLAEQIRMVLARFSPNGPQIVALKSSEAYQKAAHLTVGTPGCCVGQPGPIGRDST